ncbi:MAG: hypothetical protein GXZ07_01070 [Firmicutes bacterium]|nr:hypothetical protein [Bacillota bacterium]
MFNAVTDVVGINRLTKTIFTRAAGAVVGMANAEVKQEESGKKTVLLCAKGTTEAANRKIRQRIIDTGFVPMTFHCWGYGPAAVEQVIKDGYINGGVIEYASDWLDRIAGGSSYPPDDRYENAGKLGLPQVFVPGSCDFVVANPGTFPDRKMQPHNQAAGLFRSKKEELIQVGQEIGEKLSKSKGPVTVVIPLKGFSICDGNGGPLTDLDADMGFIEGIAPFEGKIKIKKVNAHVLEDKFADAVIDAFLENVALAEETAVRVL